MIRPATAAVLLADADPVIAALVEAHGRCRFGRRPAAHERFATLAKSICSQQIAGAAARSIWARVQAAVGEPFTAERVLALPDEVLRGAGLSRSKVASLRDLAEHVSTGKVDLRRIARLDDEAVIAALIPVRGIGRWTAEMFCIFGLHRLDIWPVTDLGVRHGYAVAHGLPTLPSPAELQVMGERFAPYRSVAAWYCWRASEAGRRDGVVVG